MFQQFQLTDCGENQQVAIHDMDGWYAGKALGEGWVPYTCAVVPVVIENQQMSKAFMLMRRPIGHRIEEMTNEHNSALKRKDAEIEKLKLEVSVLRSELAALREETNEP